MKEIKLERGITLIALIITIIILLILAVVTIGSIKNNNIITYAQNASKDYNAEKDKEESTILSYEELIDDSINPSTKELNFWQKKGLTSENVKFDTLYKGTINLDGSYEVMHFGFYSNGDICVNFSETDMDISIKDEEGNNNTGNNGGDKQFVETYEGLFKTSTNTITLPLNRVGENEDYMTLRYTDNNTVEVYYGFDREFDENGHIPESASYLKGTLSKQ